MGTVFRDSCVVRMMVGRFIMARARLAASREYPRPSVLQKAR